jgi:hypothetical protein
VKVVDGDHPLFDLNGAVPRKEELPTSLLFVLLVEPHRGLDAERRPCQPLQLCVDSLVDLDNRYATQGRKLLQLLLVVIPL